MSWRWMMGQTIDLAVLLVAGLAASEARAQPPFPGPPPMMGGPPPMMGGPPPMMGGPRLGGPPPTIVTWVTGPVSHSRRARRHRSVPRRLS